MNREDILQMGRQAGSFIELAQEKDLLWLERFAALVASAEREACIVDIQWHIPRAGRHTPEYQMAMRMIERIRARKES